MDNFIILILLSVIFWPIMILLDAVIAFYLPAKRVEARLMDKKTIKKLTRHYGKGFLNAIKPNVTNFKAEIRNELTEDVKVYIDHITAKIDELCDNDIPQMIEEKVQPVYQQLNNVSRELMGVLGATGIKARKEKEAQTLLMEEYILKSNSNYAKLLNVAKLARMNKAMTKAEYRQAVQFVAQMCGIKDGSLKGMSLLQGIAPQEASILGLQTGSQEGQMAEIEAMTPAEKEASIIDHFQQVGISPAVTKKIIKDGQQRAEELKTSEPAVAIENEGIITEGVKDGTQEEKESSKDS